MRQILIPIALAVLSAPAYAGPGSNLAEAAHGIAGEADIRAERAALRPAAPADTLELGDAFVLSLEQFAVDALLLSRAIDEAGGPMDLRCIFRGMSEDATGQIAALTNAGTRADRARVYREVSNLMGDAQAIAPAVDEEAGLDDSLPRVPCPATAASAPD